MFKCNTPSQYFQVKPASFFHLLRVIPAELRLNAQNLILRGKPAGGKPSPTAKVNAAVCDSQTAAFIHNQAIFFCNCRKFIVNLRLHFHQLLASQWIQTIA